MRFLFRVAAGLTLSLLAACATQPAGPDPALLTVVARLPQSLAGFELQESGPNIAPNSKEPSTTWRARYMHPASGSVAQVLVGPPLVPPVPDGPESAAVRDTTNLLALAAQAGAGGGGLTRVPDFGVGAPGQPRELRCSDLRLQSADGPVIRMMNCTTGIAGGLVSVGLFTRHSTQQADIARLFLVNFALQVTRVLRGVEAPPPATSEEEPEAGGTPVFRL